MSIIDNIFKISDSIDDGRTIKDIFAYTIEEVGELATEINIETGYSKKLPSEDGILGEAIDSIICLVDIIHKTYPDVTSDDIEGICRVKLLKWFSKYTPEKE